MESTEWSDWFEKIWEYREEIIYPELFGKLEGIYALTANTFLKTFGQESYDPRWLFYGVFISSPSAKRNSWLYVTSGMSNPWDDESPNPSRLSGLGCEFVFETVEKADWAILQVQNIMAYEILLSCGRFEGRDPIGFYDRMTLRSSIKPGFDSAIRNIMACPPVGYPATFNLESGEVEFVALVGITDDEAQYARENEGEKLVELLTRAGAFPITDPARKSVISA
ncbi:MAG TPA: suppressor of fused domain protein [Blastocatellia bacterium]|nr:suppressor of fused domain protein [Blastocatellia bacterium]